MTVGDGQPAVIAPSCIAAAVAPQSAKGPGSAPSPGARILHDILTLAHPDPGRQLRPLERVVDRLEVGPERIPRAGLLRFQVLRAHAERKTCTGTNAGPRLSACSTNA